jgi:hypothetical protein
MTSRPIVKTPRRLLLAGLLTQALVMQSCSLLLKFEECTADADCASSGGVCVDAICEVPEGPPRVEVSGVISANTTWRAANVYVLKNIITILPGVTLTIEAGTRIEGERNSALVGREGSVLIAKGTRELPIVFTSAKPVGQRLAGDWGGVALLGKARVNRPNATLNILPNAADAKFGGDDDTWNCGTLEYVRIEFGGGKIDGQNALNGLTLAGCGSKTQIDHVHSHFGGTVSLKYVALSRSQSDAFDIDLGWRGTIQYLAIIQDPAAENGVEVDNLKENPAATPRDDFKIYNYTLIGANKEGTQRGIQFKDGAGGFFSHGIITGFSQSAIDITGAESASQAMMGKTIVQKTLFFDNGKNGKSHFPTAADSFETDATSMMENDGGLDEVALFTEAALENRLDKDPQIPNTFDLVKPGWSAGATNTTGVPAPPAPFDQTAVYLGAFAPGSIPWTDAWTEFPGS